MFRGTFSLALAVSLIGGLVPCGPPVAAQDAPPAANAATGLQYPLGIAVTEQGEIFVADRNLPGVRQIRDGQIAAYFTGSKKFRTPLNAVRCLALDAQGKLLAGDSATREVYRFDEPGKPTPLTQGGIGIPMSIAVNSQGELLVADLEIHRLVKVPAAGGTPERIAEIPAPKGVYVDSQDRVWVLSGVGHGKLYRVAKSGEVEKLIDDCGFQFPHNLVVDADETVYVSDGYAKTIWKIPPGGKPAAWVSGPPLMNPVGLTRRGDTFYVVDPHAKGVFQIDREGKLAPLNLKQ